MTKEITLNRKQLGQLVRIFEMFQDCDKFTLIQKSDNGIGPVITVNFSLFDSNNDTKVDITDLGTW